MCMHALVRTTPGTRPRVNPISTSIGLTPEPDLHIYVSIYISISTYLSATTSSLAFLCLIRERRCHITCPYLYTDDLYTKGTRAHTHRELIREWLWETTDNSRGYI